MELIFIYCQLLSFWGSFILKSVIFLARIFNSEYSHNKKLLKEAEKNIFTKTNFKIPKEYENKLDFYKVLIEFGYKKELKLSFLSFNYLLYYFFLSILVIPQFWRYYYIFYAVKGILNEDLSTKKPLRGEIN